jgi:hypothetical protein
VRSFHPKASIRSIENHNSYPNTMYYYIVTQTIILNYIQTYTHFYFITIIKANLGLTLNPFNRCSGKKVRLFTQKEFLPKNSMKIFDCKLSHQTT